LVIEREKALDAEVAATEDLFIQVRAKFLKVIQFRATSSVVFRGASRGHIFSRADFCGLLCFRHYSSSRFRANIFDASPGQVNVRTAQSEQTESAMQ
jgi:hypothetical protein